MNKSLKLTTYVTIVLYLTGCASSGMNTTGSSSSGSDECNAVSTGAMGALAGGLLGAAIGGKDDAAKGAVIGGAVGAIGCMAFNYHSKQTKTAQQVNQEYETNHGNLPAAPTVTDHKVAFSKSTAVRGKDEIVISSKSTIVDGATQPITKVEEKLVVVDSSGARKPVSTKSPTNTSGGEYSNTFKITPPEGMAEGKYKIESDIYVNGKLASKSGGNVSIVLDHGGIIEVAQK